MRFLAVLIAVAVIASHSFLSNTTLSSSTSFDERSTSDRLSEDVGEGGQVDLANPAESSTGGQQGAALSLRDLQGMDKDALNSVLRETGIVKFIRNKLQDSSNKYSELKASVDEKVDNMHKNMEAVLDKLKQQEGELDQRLYALEQQLKMQLASVQDSSKAAALSWRLPVMGLGLCLALLTGAWCVQYNRLAKMKDW